MMCDTCSYATKALQNVEFLLASNESLPVKCDYINFRPRVKIVLGAYHSEVTVAVARLLNVYMVPLVSHRHFMNGNITIFHNIIYIYT